VSSFAKTLVKWHTNHGRKNLPWQHTTNPYFIWLSEIMLQQTQVATVIPYFEKFIKTFPDIASLARAEEAHVMQLWSGLGYYSRARNLYDAANIILTKHEGIFPCNFEEIIQLPGIGRSTAGAICAFSFKQNYPILDGNVKRVFCRFYAIEEWSGKTNVEKKLWQIAQENLPKHDIQIYTQAIMDLGATICIRSKPRCTECPLIKNCQSFQKNLTQIIPAKKPVKKLPFKKTNILILKNAKNIFFIKRRKQAVWRGLWSLPEFISKKELQIWMIKKLDGQYKVVTGGKKLATFSHYKLEMIYHLVNIDNPNILNDIENGLWLEQNEIENAALPSPIKKLVKEICL